MMWNFWKVICVLWLFHMPVMEGIGMEDSTPKNALGELTISKKGIATGQVVQFDHYGQEKNNLGKNLMLSPGVYFTIDDGWGSYTGKAVIHFDGIDYAYDPVFGGNLIYCSQGTYSYIVTPEDNSRAIIHGTVTISSNSVESVKVKLGDAHRIDFYVKTPASEAIEGASVTFDGITLLTDASGLASFERFPLGTYLYSVSKPGYSVIENKNIDVTAQVETENVTLNSVSYNVTFTVTGSGYILEGAIVKLNGTELNTNAAGKATFRNMPVGNYVYTVTKSGYKDETGIVEISDGDVIQQVDLLITTENVQFPVKTVELFPNPAKGSFFVNLPFSIDKKSTIRITNIFGSVVLENKVQGNLGPIKIDLSGLDDGIYFVRIYSGDLNSTIKLVKQ